MPNCSFCRASALVYGHNGPFLRTVNLSVTAAATIQLPYDTIRVAIFASRYDIYRDTFLQLENLRNNIDL